MDLAVKSLAPRPAAVRAPRPSREEAEAAVRTLLAFIGDEPDREGLRDTPRRVVRAYEELFSGYGASPEPILARTFREVGGYGDIVLVRDIPFQSFCEHHMLPFIGHAHIGYYPTDGVIGLSKLARLVDVYARRLQTQETLTQQVADALDAAIAPKGVAVMLSAEHLCMSMRGVRKAGSSTTTTAFAGVFADDAAERDKFFRLVHAPQVR